jgi:hypothetical protein
MIALSKQTATFLQCQKDQIEAYFVSSGIEIAIPTTIDLAQCLHKGALTVKVELIKQIENVKISGSSIAQINSQLKSSTLARNITSDSTQVLASKSLDVTRLIPNTVPRGQDFSILTIEEIRSLFRPLSTLAVSPDEAVAQVNTREVTQKTDRVLADEGRDPATQKIGSFPIDTVSALRATSVTDQFLVSTLSPALPPKTRLVLSDSSRAPVRVVVKYTGSRNDIAGSKIRITVRAKNLEAQVLTLRPQISDLLKRSELPTRPPKVTAGVASSGVLKAFVTQQDDFADAVVVSGRRVKDYTSPTTGFSVLTSKIDCKKGQTVAVSLNEAGRWILRAHPVRSGRTSPIFSSIVAGKTNPRTPAFASIVAINTQSGVSVDFITTDSKADRVLIRRVDVRSKTVSLLTQAPVTVSSAVGLIDTEIEDLASVVYEADLYRVNGDVVQRCAISESVTRLEPRGIVGAQIVATPVTSGNQVVQITITPDIKQNDVNFLVEYIKGIGLEASFQTDLETLKKSLLDCVKFDVTRFDLQTGESKFVGETSSSIEDDIDDVKISSNFLYLIDAFVRSPSQVTDVINDRSNRPTGVNPKVTRLGLHIAKSDIDKINTKSSTLSDARRFFSRSNFETGTMPSTPATDGFADGRTGDTFTARVAVNPPLPTVSAVSVTKIAGIPTVSWEITGDAGLIDRYVVLGKSGGTTWTAGTASSVGASTVLQFTDHNTYPLPRYVTYSVHPVYLTGRSGDPMTAQAIFLEDVREV